MNFIFDPKFIEAVDKAFTSKFGLILLTAFVFLLLAQLVPNNLAGGLIFNRSSLWATFTVLTIVVFIRFVFMLLTWELLIGLVVLVLLVLAVLFLRARASRETLEEVEDEEE